MSRFLRRMFGGWSKARFPGPASALLGWAVFYSLWALSVTSGFAFVALRVPQSARDHAQRAQELLAHGDLQAAEAELRRAIELEARDPALFGSLGAVLGMEGKPDESNVYLQKALDIDPNDLTSRRNLASNEFQLGQIQAAQDNLKRILKDNPGDPTAILLLGMVAEESKDYATAAQLLSSVPDQVQQRAESIAALARAYYRTGRGDQARELLSRLQGHPAGPQGVFLGGRVAADANDFSTAERMFASIWATYPDTAKLGYQLALAQYHDNKVKESQATLNKLLSGGNETSDICNLLAWCLYKQGEQKNAVAKMDRAIALDPSRESNYLDVGTMLLEARRYAGALLAAQKALEIDPDSYRAYRLKGQVEIKLDRLADAEKSYARAVELNPDDPESFSGLASAQLDNGKIQAAEATFKKGLERMPQNAAIYEAYGRMLVWLGGAGDETTEARAISLFREALALDGARADSHYELGKLASRRGKVQEALEELETARRLDPTSSKVHYSLALVYRKLGRTPEAEAEMAKYRNLKAKESEPSGSSTRRDESP